MLLITATLRQYGACWKQALMCTLLMQEGGRR